METIKIWSDRPSEQQAGEIARMIGEGEIVILPTDTVYSIVCDALNPKAIARLCQLKGLNPEKNHLAVMCADISMASEYAHIDDGGYRLLKEYTPGPFTFLFRAGRNLPKAFKGRKTVGIRIPDSGTARGIVKALGHPVVTTSIEFEDSDHAREPELIAETYESQGVSMIVDNGEGAEEYSTIVDCTSGYPEVIREGKGEIFLDN
ncbi:MAG: threonylcarbamoyl-AMP synthase [Muribaculaceae bacterium]|nr:threonylcarbamoyl-AMP synthase [Muribaculaceae bacterium]